MAKHSKQQILQYLKGHVGHLSKCKYASNVVEFVLKMQPSSYWAKLIMGELVEESDEVLSTLMSNQFANYVLQTALLAPDQLLVEKLKARVEKLSSKASPEIHRRWMSLIQQAEKQKKNGPQFSPGSSSSPSSAYISSPTLSAQSGSHSIDSVNLHVRSNRPKQGKANKNKRRQQNASRGRNGVEGTSTLPGHSRGFSGGINAPFVFPGAPHLLPPHGLRVPDHMSIVVPDATCYFPGKLANGSRRRRRRTVKGSAANEDNLGGVPFASSSGGYRDMIFANQGAMIDPMNSLLPHGGYTHSLLHI